MRRAWPLLAALVAAAALLDLGSIHRLEHGDSIVPVLVSLQRWTPLYWDQERYGMLLPLLALPVRDPLWNLLLQRGLMILAGLAAVVLLARHLLAERDWPLTGAVAAGTLLLAAPAPWRFEYLGDQPYGLSLALALAGLAFAEPAAGGARRSRWRLAAGLLLVLLAHWVNPATGVLLGLLALARALEDWFTTDDRGAVRERLLVDAGLLAVGLAAGQASILLYPALTGLPLRLTVGFLPLAGWPSAWGAMVARAWEEGRGWGWSLLVGLGLAALLLRLPSSRELPARRAAPGGHAAPGGGGLRRLRGGAGLGGGEPPPPAVPGAVGAAPPPRGGLAAGRAAGAGGPRGPPRLGGGAAGAAAGGAGGGRRTLPGTRPGRPGRGGGEAHRGRAGGPLPAGGRRLLVGLAGGLARLAGGAGAGAARRGRRRAAARLGGDPPGHAHGDAVEGAAGRVDPRSAGRTARSRSARRSAGCAPITPGRSGWWSGGPRWTCWSWSRRWSRAVGRPQAWEAGVPFTSRWPNGAIRCRKTKPGTATTVAQSVKKSG